MEEAVVEKVEEKSSESRFQKGDVLDLVRVRFPGNSRSFPFLVGKRSFSYGQKVLAMSDRGMAVGYINSFIYKEPFRESLLPLRSIKRAAEDDDLQQEKERHALQKETEQFCLNMIENHKLDMNLTHLEFTEFGKKVVFYFTAPSRVDFRNLVRELVSELKIRVELRQVSVRDRAAALGGLGPCGRELCCSSFLTQYGSVNLKMAKNQDLSLNFNKLNGVCGQLKCCLKYENQVYSDKRKVLPQEGSFIKALNGDCGKVTKLHILEEQFDMLTDQGVIKRYDVGQFDPKHLPDNSWKFPERFDHISRETSQVIQG